MKNSIPKIVAICLLCAFACGGVSGAVVYSDPVLTPDNRNYVIGDEDVYAKIQLNIPPNSVISNITIWTQLNVYAWRGTFMFHDGQPPSERELGSSTPNAPVVKRIDGSELSCRAHETTVIIEVRGHIDPSVTPHDTHFRAMHVGEQDAAGYKVSEYDSPEQLFLKPRT